MLSVGSYGHFCLHIVLQHFSNHRSISRKQAIVNPFLRIAGVPDAGVYIGLSLCLPCPVCIATMPHIETIGCTQFADHAGGVECDGIRERSIGRVFRDEDVSQ